MPDKPFGIIYRATSPSGKVYIGQTTKTLKYRRAAHINNAKCGRRQTAFSNSLRKYGDRLIWDIVAECHGKPEMDITEKYCIAYYQAMGKSYNMTDGGEGTLGWIATPATRKKMSESAPKTHSPEHVANYIKGRKGKKLPPESCVNMGIAQRGRVVPPEWREKISKGNKGKKRSAEQNARQSARMMGNTISSSPEARAKISVSKLGKKMPEEQRLRMVGRKLSPENCAAISAALKGNTYRADWAKRKAAKAGEYPLC